MKVKLFESFRRVIYFELIFVSIIVIGVFGNLWISSEYDAFNQQSKKERQDFINNQESIIKNEVNRQIDYIEYMKAQAEEKLRENVKSRTYEAYNIAINIYNENKYKKDKKEIEKLIKDALRNVRFNDGRGYYFIDTLDGNVILYPVMKENEGSNILELKDSEGNYALKDEIELVKKQGEGYATGYWANPNYKDNAGHKKITFVKRFEPYNWYMGTGEYIDDVENDIQKEIVDRISKIRFGTQNQNYIFIDNFQGVELCNGVYTDYVGKNIFEMEDINGTKVIQEQINIAKNNLEGGVLIHYWKTPDYNEVFQKMTFVRAIPEWNWVVGSGVKFDELEKTISDNEIKMKNEVIHKIKNIIIISVVVLLSVFILTRYLMEKSQRSFEIFFNFLNNAARKHAEIDVKKMEYSEFKNLAVAANSMICERNRIEEAIRNLNNELHVRVQERTKEIQELNENLDKKVEERTIELSNLINVDGLTQIYNHNYMFERLKFQINRAKEYGEKLFVVMFDIDHFKKINDTYGHQCGDNVLTSIAKTIKESIREDDIVGRYGGEEFILILTGGDITNEYEIVENIRKRIMNLRFKEKGLIVTISGGIAEYSFENAVELVKKADDKLYEAKRKGRNRIIQ